MEALTHVHARSATLSLGPSTVGLDPPLFDVELAYAAGLFDGEGHIRQGPGRSFGIEVTNTNLRVLRWMQHHFGGRIVAQTSRSQHHAPSYHWRLRSAPSYEFLKLVQPYLVAKSSECMQALARYEATH
jgi:hypothetical protein